jgi:hypothetical protein
MALIQADQNSHTHKNLCENYIHTTQTSCFRPPFQFVFTLIPANAVVMSPPQLKYDAVHVLLEQQLRREEGFAKSLVSIFP